MRTQVGVVATKGGAGTATGTEVVGVQPCEVEAIELKFAEGAAAGTKVKITNREQVLLEVTGKVNAVYYVRAQSHNNKGEPIAVGEGKWNPVVVNGDIKIEVTAANESTTAVSAVFFLQSP